MPLCTGCDQLTACSSLWWSVKLPAVWKNFFGTIGARRRTSARSSRSPVSAHLDRRARTTRGSSRSRARPSCRRPAGRPDRRRTSPASSDRPLSLHESDFDFTDVDARPCQGDSAIGRRRPGTPAAAAPAWRSSRRGSAARTCPPRRAARPPRRTCASSSVAAGHERVHEARRRAVGRIRQIGVDIGVVAVRIARSSSSVSPACAADRLVGVLLERRLASGRRPPGWRSRGRGRSATSSSGSRCRAPAAASPSTGWSRKALNGPSSRPSSSTSRNSCGPAARASADDGVVDGALVVVELGRARASQGDRSRPSHSPSEARATPRSSRRSPSSDRQELGERSAATDHSRACTATLTPATTPPAGADDRDGDRAQSVGQLLVLHRPAVRPHRRQLAAQLGDRGDRIGPAVCARTRPARSSTRTRSRRGRRAAACRSRCARPASVEPTWMLAVTRSELRSRTR